MNDELDDYWGPLTEDEEAHLEEAIDGNGTFDQYAYRLMLRRVESWRRDGSLGQPGIDAIPMMVHAQTPRSEQRTSSIIAQTAEQSPWVVAWNRKVHGPVSATTRSIWINDDYFREAATDHLIIINTWSVLSSVASVGDTKLMVPARFRAVVGTQDDWWIILEIVCNQGDDVAIEEIRIHRAFQGLRPPDSSGFQGVFAEDVSGHPNFPLQRWKSEALVKANELLMAGGSLPKYRFPSAARQRSDSPEAADLAHVVELREEQRMSFGSIGEAIGKSEPTARRWYKRAKEQGL